MPKSHFLVQKGYRGTTRFLNTCSITRSVKGTLSVTPGLTGCVSVIANRDPGNWTQLVGVVKRAGDFEIKLLHLVSVISSLSTEQILAEYPAHLGLRSPQATPVKRIERTTYF